MEQQRFCLDYGAVIEVMKVDEFPLTKIKRIVDDVERSRVFRR